MPESVNTPLVVGADDRRDRGLVGLGCHGPQITRAGASAAGFEHPSSMWRRRAACSILVGMQEGPVAAWELESVEMIGCLPAAALRRPRPARAAGACSRLATLCSMRVTPATACTSAARGLLKVVRPTHDANLVLDRIAPGEAFGELAVLNSAPRSASIIAIEGCETHRARQGRHRARARPRTRCGAPHAGPRSPARSRWPRRRWRGTTAAWRRPCAERTVRPARDPARGGSPPDPGRGVQGPRDAACTSPA